MYAPYSKRGVLYERMYAPYSKRGVHYEWMYAPYNKRGVLFGGNPQESAWKPERPKPSFGALNRPLVKRNRRFSRFDGRGNPARCCPDALPLPLPDVDSAVHCRAFRFAACFALEGRVNKVQRRGRCGGGAPAWGVAEDAVRRL
jgi:hypothetical protein